MWFYGCPGLGIGFNKLKTAQLFLLGSVVLWSIVFMLVEKQGLAGWERQADNCFNKNSQIGPALVIQTPQSVCMSRTDGSKPPLQCRVMWMDLKNNLIEVVLPLKAGHFSGKMKNEIQQLKSKAEPGASDLSCSSLQTLPGLNHLENSEQ